MSIPSLKILYSLLREIDPRNTRLNSQYISGLMNMIKTRSDPSLKQVISPIEAYAIILPFFQAIHDKNSYPEQQWFKQLLKLLENQFSFSFSTGLGKLLLDGNVNQIQDTKLLKVEFYWAIHMNFAANNDMLNELMVKELISQEDPQRISSNRLYFLRPLFYLLVRLYFEKNTKILELSHVLLENSLDWENVPYTNNPGAKFKQVNQNIATIQNAYYPYAINLIYSKLKAMNSKKTKLFPVKAIKQIKNLLPQKPDRATPKDLIKLAENTIVFTANIDEVISTDTFNLLISIFDSNIDLLTNNMKEFNPFYTSGLISEFKEMKKIITDKKPKIKKMESLFGVLEKEETSLSISGHTVRLKNEISFLGLQNPFISGNIKVWENVYNSYSITKRSPVKSNIILKAFTDNSNELSTTLRNNPFLITTLEQIFSKKIENETQTIISMNFKKIFERIKTLTKDNLLNAVIIFIDQGSRFVWPIRQKNTNLYIATRKTLVDSFDMILINIDGTLVFPTHLEKLTSELKRKFGIQKNTIIETDYLSKATDLSFSFTDPVNNNLLYALWYSENIMRGMKQIELSIVEDLFGNEYLDWINNNYFNQIPKIAKRLGFETSKKNLFDGDQ